MSWERFYKKTLYFIIFVLVEHHAGIPSLEPISSDNISPFPHFNGSTIRYVYAISKMRNYNVVLLLL